MKSSVRAGLVLAVIVMGCGGEANDTSAAETPEVAASPAQSGEAADAAAVCAQLEAAGIARNCARVLPGGANARARFRFDFDLVSVPDKGGAVLTFENAADYEATVATYAEVALIAGPHRYGNPGRLVFVQLNEGASLEVGDRTRAIVEGL